MHPPNKRLRPTMCPGPTGTKQTQSWPSLDPYHTPPATEMACHPHSTDEDIEASLVAQTVKNLPAM